MGSEVRVRHQPLQGRVPGMMHRGDKGKGGKRRSKDREEGETKKKEQDQRRSTTDVPEGRQDS